MVFSRFLPIFLLCFITPTALADVYKFTDKKGNVHFTTTPPSETAKPAKLPEIVKKDFKLPPPTMISCKQHGGINCQAGADKDGSVICADGFLDATARFRFYCLEAALHITEEARKSPDGSFSLVIRNNKSTKAIHPQVSFLSKSVKKYSLESTGDIEPFGIGEFTLVLPSEELEQKQATLPITQFSVTCSNCQ